LADFKSLPLGALEAIIRSDNFKVDSENSVLYAALIWLEAQLEYSQDKKEQVMKKIIPHVRFLHLLLHFLLDIVPEISQKYKGISEITDKYDTALEYKAGGRGRMEKKNSTERSVQLIPRSTFKDGQHASLKHSFTNVNTWDISRRYFSPKFIVNGYEWYFFCVFKNAGQLDQGDAMDIDNTENGLLFIYLRCHSNYMPKRHYLPISTSVSVELRPSSERKFKSNNVIFESSEKAIGGLLSVHPEEDTLHNIKSGVSAIVINNSMTVTINIDFLESGETCKPID